MQRRIYLRLIEKVESTASDSQRLDAVRRAVEQLGNVQWEHPPRFHPRGGFDVAFVTSDAVEFDNWLKQLDAAGYWGAI